MVSNGPRWDTSVSYDFKLLPSDASCSTLAIQSYDPMISRLEEEHLQSSSPMSSTDQPDCEHIMIAGAEYVLTLSHCCLNVLSCFQTQGNDATNPCTILHSAEYIYLDFHRLWTTMAHLSPANVHEKMSTSPESGWRRCRKLSRLLRAKKKETRRQNWMR